MELVAVKMTCFQVAAIVNNTKNHHTADAFKLFTTLKQHSMAATILNKSCSQRRKKNFIVVFFYLE